MGRAILENNEEDDEDTADLGDDEINDLLARGDHEVEIFTQMDLERTSQEEQAWIMSGHSLPAPERLIADSELPEVYHIEHVIEEEPSAILDTRRTMGVVRYDDGLTEEQWTAAIEDEVDLDEVIEQNRRRQTNPRYNYGDENDLSGSEGMERGDSVRGWDDSEVGSPAPAPVPAAAPNKNRKRGRPPKEPKQESRATSVDTGSLNGDFKVSNAKRRKTSKLGANDPARVQMEEIMEACFDPVEDVDNEEEGHQCCGLFYKLPSKKDYPEYYIMIPRPICMNDIRKKIKNHSYNSVEEYVADWRLMFANARTFNDDASIVYKDANSMEQAFNAKLAELTGSNELGPPSTNDNSGQISSASSAAGGIRIKKIADSEEDE